MTDGIEAVIKASRQRGGFRKKGYFTLATQKAKAKVSEYALPDHFLYVLELVQSAVALGAVYIDVATEERYAVISFAGAHYTRKDLEHMFDFLVTTRQEDDFRARRRLAIGMAAALSLKEANVVIETGDGTVDGSSRFELSNIKDDALIGTPKQAINGTFIKVTHAKYVNIFEECSREKNVLLNRCEYLPITLVVNGEMPFGFAAKRALTLHGYRHSISFDEGDLYGAVAIPQGWRAENAVKILTNGIVMTTMAIQTPFGFLDGVVTFDRLHKTASQYEVVQDERVVELKERLKRYVDQLARMADVTDEQRLDYLIDRPLKEVVAQGEPYTWTIEGHPFPAMAAFGLDLRRDDTMVIHFVREKPDGTTFLIRTLKYDFPLPLVGKISFGGNFADKLRFLKLGSRDSSPEKGILTFTAEVWDWVRKEIDQHRVEMLAHFEAEAKRLNVETDAAAETESDENGIIRMVDTPGESEENGFAEEPTPAIETPSPEAQSAAEATLRALHDQMSAYQQEAASEEIPIEVAPIASIPSQPTQKCAPAANAEPNTEDAHKPPASAAMPMPGYDTLATLLETTSDSPDNPTNDDPRITLLQRLLYQRGKNHDFFAHVDHRVEKTWELPPASAAVAMVDITERERSAVLINMSHPQVKKKMAECRKNPAAFLALAMLVTNALKLQSLRAPELPEFNDEKIISTILEYQV